MYLDNPGAAINPDVVARVRYSGGSRLFTVQPILIDRFFFIGYILVFVKNPGSRKIEFKSVSSGE